MRNFFKNVWAKIKAAKKRVMVAVIALTGGVVIVLNQGANVPTTPTLQVATDATPLRLEQVDVQFGDTLAYYIALNGTLIAADTVITQFDAVAAPKVTFTLK